MGVKPIWTEYLKYRTRVHSSVSRKPPLPGVLHVRCYIKNFNFAKGETFTLYLVDDTGMVFLVST